MDNRCYLENGGSAESFFVSEDVPVGSIIGLNNYMSIVFVVCTTNEFLFLGLLKINGDPTENGNINLSLKEIDSPVSILPGTKELSLTKILDKEVCFSYFVFYFLSSKKCTSN